MSRHITQAEHVLAILRRNGDKGITPGEALRDVGTMRLAARIADLRDDGHNIETLTWKTHTGANVARYVLHEDKDKRYAEQLAEATASIERVLELIESEQLSLPIKDCQE